MVMRKILLVLALAVAALGIRTAWGKGRDVHRTLHVVKSVIPASVHMAWVQSVGTLNEVQIAAIPEFLTEGMELEVIDTQGYVGRVRIGTGIQKQSLGCQTSTYQLVKATFLQTPQRNVDGYATAIMPLRDEPTHAKIFAVAPDTAELPALQPGMSRTFLDIDGDGTTDMYRDWGTCAVASGRSTYCLETRAREKGGNWKQFDVVQEPACW
jgi:hypothetical protein